MRLRKVVAVLIASAWAVGGMPLSPVAAAPVPEPASVTVQPVAGIPENFAMGVDVSSVLSLEESGVVFRDASGKPADLFTVLASAGVTDVRVRVWNDPFDAQRRGYGGGNVDVARAVKIGKRATAAGLGVLVDFHYSDFWADPGKQRAPKSWATLNAKGKAEALEAFTRTALEQFAQEGVNVEMVQIGNETNNSIAGVSGWDEMAMLFSAGAAAVRDVLPEAKVALHFTNPEKQQYTNFAEALQTRNVDYDVFLSSYYPYWHGSLDNLTSELATVREQFDVEVGVAETSWAYTLEDGDGHGNVIDTADKATSYPISVQGQATAIRDVIAATVAAGGIGVYYWEPAWLPVGPSSQMESNKILWERDGSGWASSYANEFDPDDAGKWFGGSAWDNQALFDFAGNPLDSLNVFRYVHTGAVAPREVQTVDRVSAALSSGDPVELPSTVTVRFTDGSTEERPVTWSKAAQWIKGPGTYTIHGDVEGELQATATVTVAKTNLLRNPGFEDTDMSMWATSGNGLTLGATDDPHSGERSAHFWADRRVSFTLTQTVDGLPEGAYVASGVLQGAAGAALGANDVARIRVTDGVSSSDAAFTLDGYRAWSEPATEPLRVAEGGSLTVTVEVNLPAGSWGTIDDLSLVAHDPNTADREALSALLQSAESIDRAVYTSASLLQLDEAVEIAQVVMQADAPSQVLVDDATGVLRAALEDLAKVQKEVPRPEDDPAVRDDSGSDDDGSAIEHATEERGGASETGAVEAGAADAGLNGNVEVRPGLPATGD